MDREVVLLTGMPNARARHALVELLDRGARVRVLVRGDDREAVAAFLATALDESRERVSIVEGDPSAMDLGLSGDEFGALARELDRIHHVAIATDATLERKVVEAVNVGGAREILELAEACTKLRALVFHSLTSVSGSREGQVREDDPVPVDGFRDLVAETLARAERMMRAAMAKTPIVVARAGMIVGDSRTGEVDRLDGFYLLVLLIMTSPRDFALPLPSRGDAPLHLVPVDYVATAACAIGADPRAVGKTVHLVDPEPMPSRTILEVVAQAAGRRMGRGFIPANVTKALLSAPGIDRIARSPRLLLDALATNVTYGTENADAILAGTGITCPRFETYADVLVDHVRRRMDERRERRARSMDYDPLA
jgi:thioester reductase-like protein